MVTGTTERGEVLISQPLRVECNCLDEEAQAHALKLAPMHMTNWEEAQGEDMLLATCRKWMSTKKDVPHQKRDALLKTCMGEHSDSEDGKVLFCIRNSLTLKKGMLYVNIMPKVRLKDSWPLWCLLHISTQLSMVCTKMSDTKVNRECWHWPRSISGCQRWMKIAQLQ